MDTNKQKWVFSWLNFASKDSCPKKKINYKFILSDSYSLNNASLHQWLHFVNKVDLSSTDRKHPEVYEILFSLVHKCITRHSYCFLKRLVRSLTNVLKISSRRRLMPAQRRTMQVLGFMDNFQQVFFSDSLEVGKLGARCPPN